MVANSHIFPSFLKQQLILLLLLTLSLHVKQVSADFDQVQAEDLINDILNNQTLYNHNIRPRGDNASATFVVVNLFLRNIGTIGKCFIN